MVVAEHDRVKVVCELFGVRVGSELALRDSRPDDVGHEPQPLALKLDEPITHRAGAVVELDRSGNEETASGYLLRLRPVEPALKERTHPRLSARLCERGTHDLLDETVRRGLEDLHLQGFLGLEVREDAALREPQIFR